MIRPGLEITILTAECGIENRRMSDVAEHIPFRRKTVLFSTPGPFLFSKFPFSVIFFPLQDSGQTPTTPIVFSFSCLGAFYLKEPVLGERPWRKKEERFLFWLDRLGAHCYLRFTASAYCEFWVLKPSPNLFQGKPFILKTRHD